MSITLSDEEINTILDKAKSLAQNEFQAGWASRGDEMNALDFHVMDVRAKQAKIRKLSEELRQLQEEGTNDN